MKVISRLISLLLLVLPLTVSAQHAFTLPLGETVKMSLVIDTPKASISGICLMQREEQKVVGTVVNEFGIKAFDVITFFRSNLSTLIGTGGNCGIGKIQNLSIRMCGVNPVKCDSKIFRNAAAGFGKDSCFLIK